ncbi:hypothetical protein [Bacillus sp. 166amftsu]|nr:hypothetical protein [Bacillus sp. 166amftsu]SDY43901.1 hypothetical protein SAMN04488156_101398 [Bacillus sp. 166amftsu]
MRKDNFDPGGLGGSRLIYDPNLGGGYTKDTSGGYIKDPGTGI